MVHKLTGAGSFLKVSLEAVLEYWCNWVAFLCLISVKFITGHLWLKTKLWCGLLSCLEDHGFLRNTALTLHCQAGVTASHCIGVESWRNQMGAQDISQLMTNLLPSFPQCLQQTKLSGSLNSRPFILGTFKGLNLPNNTQSQSVMLAASSCGR